LFWAILKLPGGADLFSVSLEKNQPLSGTHLEYAMKNLVLTLIFASLPVIAADKPPAPPKGSTPVPDGAPMVGNLGEPAITIRNKGSERVEEYRLKGKLYMMKVTPPKGKPYYLVDQLGRGEFTRNDGPTPPMAVPQWVVKTF
jgi:hypothetical protein